jgi:hypothetical protein
LCGDSAYFLLIRVFLNESQRKQNGAEAGLPSYRKHVYLRAKLKRGKGRPKRTPINKNYIELRGCQKIE